MFREPCVRAPALRVPCGWQPGALGASWAGKASGLIREPTKGRPSTTRAPCGQLCRTPRSLDGQMLMGRKLLASLCWHVSPQVTCPAVAEGQRRGGCVPTVEGRSDSARSPSVASGTVPGEDAFA